MKTPEIATVVEPAIKLQVPVLLVDSATAAAMIGVGRRTLDKLPIPKTKIPGVNRVLYRVADLEHYVLSLV